MRVKLQSEFLLPEHVSRGGEFPAENGSISDNDMFCALGGKLGGNCADEDEDGVGGGGESVTHAEDDLLVRPPRGYGAVAGTGGLGSGGGAFAGLIGGIGNGLTDRVIGCVINGVINGLTDRVIDGVIGGVINGLTIDRIGNKVIDGLTIDRIGNRVINEIGNRVINRVIDGLIERVVNELIDRILDTICDRLIKSGNGEIALMIIYLILRGWICNGTTERILCRRIDASVAIADWLFHPGLDRSIRVARTTERRVASRRRL